ncbi:hypothetical protein ACMD2_26715 [Ananas comosus]|uniref:PB1 domain-containing protein n=1 Tax=Ananas comosus TaxID=4615 RepID=A0A199VXF4_ANACO|nr:hypothetical protein ACMD2_26715 [Ananas comosus]
MASHRMSLSVYWDGQLDMDGNGSRYFGGRKKLIAIRSDTTYANFERRIYRLVNCNREECCLKYTIRCPTRVNEYIAHDIVDDESLEGLIGLFEHYGCVSLYIEKDLYPSETQYPSQGYYTSLLHNDIDVGFLENPIGDREVGNEPGVRMTRFERDSLVPSRARLSRARSGVGLGPSRLSRARSGVDAKDKLANCRGTSESSREDVIIMENKIYIEIIRKEYGGRVGGLGLIPSESYDPESSGTCYMSASSNPSSDT